METAVSDALEPATDDCGICYDECKCTPEMREALRLIRALSDEQRDDVLGRFCAGCREYLAPGEHCNCLRDE